LRVVIDLFTLFCNCSLLSAAQKVDFENQDWKDFQSCFSPKMTLKKWTFEAKNDLWSWSDLKSFWRWWSWSDLKSLLKWSFQCLSRTEHISELWGEKLKQNHARLVQVHVNHKSLTVKSFYFSYHVGGWNWISYFPYIKVGVIIMCPNEFVPSVPRNGPKLLGHVYVSVISDF
jgi:hypothetical protein